MFIWETFDFHKFVSTITKSFPTNKQPPITLHIQPFPAQMKKLQENILFNKANRLQL